MKKKILSILITILALCTCMFTLTACGGNVEFKINFIVDNQVYATINTSGTEVIKMPENPTKEDYNFDGWFWDKDVWEKPFTANSLLDAPLSSDMSVYAKFTQKHEHDYNAVVTVPTCTSKGFTVYTCSCNDTYIDDYVDELGHNYSQPQYVWNDNKCTATRICVNDNAHIEAETITGLYVKDADATCITAEKGHFVAAFLNPAFENQYTVTNSYENGEPIEEHNWEYGNCAVCGETQLEMQLASNNQYYIVKGKGTFNGEQLNIPTAYKTLPVKSIGSNAFKDYTSLTNIVIPNSVTSIGNYAFYGCSIEKATMPTLAISYITNASLKEAVLTSGTSIGNYAFENCSNLTNVVIPSSVTSIGSYAFSSCTSLTTIEIPSSVTSIGDYAFLYCVKLVEVINKSPYIIATKGSSTNGYLGYYALAIYDSNNKFTETKLSKDSDYIIYDDVTDKILISYTGCEIDLVLPNYVTKIYKFAFKGCDGLKTVEIPDSVISIGKNAFSGCYNLRSVTIGNSVTSIGEDAFASCFKLVEVINKSTSLIITKGNNDNGYVGYYALVVYNNSGITQSQLTNDNGYIICTVGNEKILVDYTGSETSLIIPNYVTKINAHAFRDCNSIKSIEVSNNITSVGSNAFRNCSSLTSIEIPASITSIDSYAFLGCESLTKITFKDTSNWYSTGIAGAQIDLTNPSSNANSLTSTFGYYRLYKK